MAQADQPDGAGDHEHDSPSHAAKDRQQSAKSPTADARSKGTPGAKLIQVSGSGLSGPFIRRPVMTVLLTLSVIVAGIATYNKLAVNDLPAVDYPVIQVTCSYPGANPTTMANNIATPLEKQFLQIPGLDIITSASTQAQAGWRRSSAHPGNCRSICPARRHSQKQIRTISRFICSVCSPTR